MAINWQYYHWHLEPSAICTLKCPRCPRTEHPDTPWLNLSMTLEFVKTFLTPDILKTKTQRITMCGDVGDPIYCKEFIEICQYIKQQNPKIHLFIITNGSHKKTEWWIKLGAVLNQYDTVTFSIDGYDCASNNLYRVNSNYSSIINGIKTLRSVNSAVFLTWATIVFSFNQDHLDSIKQQATNLGMDSMQLTKSTKFGSKYGDAYGGTEDALEPRAEWISSSHRYERDIINLSGRTENNSNYMSTNQRLYEKISKEYQGLPVIPLCEIGNRGIYVNAEGVVFPCSWTSFPYHSLSYNGKTIKWQDSFFAQHRDAMNLNTRTLEEIVNDPLWSKCSAGWRDSDKTWAECGLKCNNNVVTQEYAVGWLTN